MSRERVPVVDSKNHERVLGTIPAPSDEPLGRFFKMAVCRNLVLARLSAHAMPEITHVTLDIVILGGQFEGWKMVQQMGLATSAKLEDLMMLSDFRLPGESAAEARHREQARRYYA